MTTGFDPGADGEPGGSQDRTSRPWLPTMVWLAVAATGVGALIVGLSLSAGSTSVVDGNQPVNVGATNPRDFTANNSPTVARNPVRPANLAVANRVDSPRFSCSLHVSFDAGKSWTPTEIPFPAGEEQPPRCFAPDLGFGPEGTLYLSFVTLAGLGNTPSALWIVSSNDDGRTLSLPVRAAGPLAFQARLLIDPSRRGGLTMTWLQAAETGNLSFPGESNPISYARSVDGGATWTAPATIGSPRSHLLAPSAASGPKGKIYVLGLDLGDDDLDYRGGHGGQGGPPYGGKWSLVLFSSTDNGATWRETPVGEVVPGERVVTFFPPSPSLAVDQSTGRIYAAFQDARSGDRDVYVWASGDGGATFGPGVRVNDTRPTDGTAQYLPKLAVAPGGRLDVVYYDRRADRDDIHNEVSFQSSTDGGRSFGKRLGLAGESFDSRIGFGRERDLPDLGSRLGLTSGSNHAVAVWTDTRAGTEGSGKQDLAKAVINFSPASRARTPLAIVAVAAIALGGFMAAISTARRSRKHL